MTDTRELILSIHMSDSHDSLDGTTYGRFRAHVDAYNPTARHGDAPVGYLCDTDALYSRFAVSSLYGNIALNSGQYYGLEWGYEPQYKLVRHHDLARISTGLKRCEKNLTKIRSTYGNEQTLGQALIYIAQAIGVVRFCWQSPRTDLGWRVETCAESARYHIDSRVQACIDGQKVAAVA